MDDLSVYFCGVKFANPFVLPSGIIQEIADHQKAITSGVGGVTLKTLTIIKREGNPLPRIWKYGSGLLNSVGLRNPGIAVGSKQISQFLAKNKNIPVIVSLFAGSTQGFEYLTEKIVPLKPTFIELNLSCPNVDCELGPPLCMNNKITSEVINRVKKITGSIPLLVKLSSGVVSIAESAKLCEQSGADGIVAINSVGPGMIIDIHKRKPVLGAKKGGVSGQAILPIAIRCVYEIYQAVKIPIIGMGGILTTKDVIQMIMAGATLVGVGTATYLKGMKIFTELKTDLVKYMKKENINHLQDLIGTAHG